MSSKKENKRLYHSKGDLAYTIVKAGISAVPIVGGPATELFSAIITPPLSRRRDAWIESIAEGLERLVQKVDGFRIEDLAENKSFITIVMHASQIAIRNHQGEKLEALRNAILNSALVNPIEDDLQLIFLKFIDDLTPWHFRILEFLNLQIVPTKRLGRTLLNNFQNPILIVRSDFSRTCR